MIAPTEERESLSEYHSGADGRTTSTRLRLFKRSPLIYRETYITKRMPAQKDEAKYAIGTGTHTLVLEPEKFSSTVKLIPRFVLSKSGAKGSAAWKQFADEHKGCVLLKQDEYDAVCWMAENVQKKLGDLLGEPGAVEKTIRWDDPATGIGCKARPDKAFDVALLLDLKSTLDITPYGFEKASCAFRYDDQAAHYQDAYEAERGKRPDFWFVCVEKVPPYRCKVREIVKADLDESRDSNHAALVDLKRRTESGDWSEPDEGQVTPIKLSPWAKSRRESTPTTSEN